MILVLLSVSFESSIKKHSFFYKCCFVAVAHLYKSCIFDGYIIDENALSPLSQPFIMCRVNIMNVSLHIVFKPNQIVFSTET